jgi:hypothetical protein
MEAIYNPKRMHRDAENSVKITQNGERVTAVKTQVVKRYIALVLIVTDAGLESMKFEC